MRIWYQSMTELTNLPRYAAFLREHITASAPAGVDVELVGLNPGTYGGRPPMEVLRYPWGQHRALAQVLDNVEHAARAGFDAFLMGSFVAPPMRLARCAVDIPVTSMAESVLLTAHTLSRRVGLVCISDHQVGTATELIDSVGLADRVVATVPIDLPTTEELVSTALGTAGEDNPSSELSESFRRAARVLIARGADVIVPAEGILSEVVRAWGISTVDDAPVLDCVEVSLAHTAMLAALFASDAVGMGRLVSYPRLPDPGHHVG